VLKRCINLFPRRLRGMKLAGLLALPACLSPSRYRKTISGFETSSYRDYSCGSASVSHGIPFSWRRRRHTDFSYCKEQVRISNIQCAEAVVKKDFFDVATKAPGHKNRGNKRIAAKTLRHETRKDVVPEQSLGTRSMAITTKTLRHKDESAKAIVISASC
jgi:hypothetical protein